MVSKTTPVNGSGKDLSTFGGRLAAERERLNVKQIDVCVFTSVSKTTQIKYESNERRPDTDYLERLLMKDFDVIYLLTGTRTTDSLSSKLSPEIQNVVDAYLDAPPLLREAAFAVLLSNRINDVRSARTIPGYGRFKLHGENDSRHQEWCDTTMHIEGNVGATVTGSATFGDINLGGKKKK